MKKQQEECATIKAVFSFRHLSSHGSAAEVVLPRNCTGYLDNWHEASVIVNLAAILGLLCTNISTK